MKSDMAPPRVFPGSEIQDESLTSDIGTPVYCAPETIISGKYNSKVDMFSLGIIFFEMVYSFSTAMQRFVVLRDIRRLIFPKDFDSKKYVNQQQIITSLLKENPKDRPSTQELLRSKLLPPKYEEQV